MTSWGQDYLTPLVTNASIAARNKIELKPRAGDSVNIIPNWILPTLPFLDEFSTDRRRPSDLKPFVASASEYYMTGLCADYKHLVKGMYKLNKNPSRIYLFDPTSPPDFVDSSNFNGPVGIELLNDTPTCTNIQSVTLYPPTYRFKFDIDGNKIDSTLLYDTVLSYAFVQEVTLKNYLWTDRYAYINSHYPMMPLGKGVATLDGLNEKGRPYDMTGFNAYGHADYLTSVPLNLSAFRASDSVYLSFLYQPQGLGDWPDLQDSLSVEFKDDRGRWIQVFNTKGLTQAQLIDTLQFRQAMIVFPDRIVPSDPNFFYDSFQFRFSNYATISGNNDHWHIDYVKLDVGRNYQDTVIRDATFAYELPSSLKNYTLLPAKQYQGYSDLKDTIIGINRNILPSIIFSTYKYYCKNENTSTIFGQNNSGLPYSANPIVPIVLKPKVDLLYPTSVSDSTYITTSVYLDISDIYPTNDTASHRQFFFNEMAYDDGTAEMAYGIQGLGTKKVAYRYYIPVKDTLAAIKIHFSNIDLNVSSLIFNLNVWKRIGMNGQSEQIIKTITNLKPIYKDTLNGYITFGLDTPLEVQDTIYVGWTQSDERNLQIGYDKNSTLGIDNTFILTNNIWSKTHVVDRGSPMIRIILDGKRNYRSSSVNETITKVVDKIQFYPNPASDFVDILSSEITEKEVLIYDMVGKLVCKDKFRKEHKMDLSHLNQGLYIIQFNSDGQTLQSEKLQIMR